MYFCCIGDCWFCKICKFIHTYCILICWFCVVFDFNLWGFWGGTVAVLYALFTDFFKIYPLFA